MIKLVVHPIEPQQGIYEDVLGQDGLGGKRHLTQEGMTKRKVKNVIHEAITFME